MKHYFILALALMVGACVSSSNDVAKPQTQKGFLGLVEKDAADVTTAKAFAGKTDIVIGNFKVAFVTESEGRNKTSGGILGGGMAGHAQADVTLAGVSDAAMQAITDKAYQHFTDSLKANGYNIVPVSSISGMDEYKKISTEKSPYAASGLIPGVEAEGKIFAPAGQVLHLMQGQGVAIGGWGFANPATGYAAVSEKTKTPILDVYYVLDFTGYGGHAGMSSASLEVGHAMSVKPGSKITLIGGHAGTFSTAQGSIGIGQPIASDKAFGTVVEETSGAEKTAGYAANVVTGMLGGSTSIFRDYTVQSSDPAYTDAAMDALTRANTFVAKQMASLR